MSIPGSREDVVTELTKQTNKQTNQRKQWEKITCTNYPTAIPKNSHTTNTHYQCCFIPKKNNAGHFSMK